MPLRNSFEIQTVDFRDQLGSPAEGFAKEAELFLRRAQIALDSIEDEQAKKDKAQKIVENWFERMGLTSFEDDADLESMSGLSQDEILLIRATVFAEELGLSITELKQAAAHYDIYGPYYPGRDAAEGESYRYGRDFNANPRTPDDPA